jgi:hypothetical protein
MSSGVRAAGLKLEAAIAATGGSVGWVALVDENVGDGGLRGEYAGDEGEGVEAAWGCDGWVEIGVPVKAAPPAVVLGNLLTGMLIVLVLEVGFW